MLSRLYLEIGPEAFLMVNLGPGIQCVLVVAFLASLHIYNTSCSNYYMMQVALDPVLMHRPCSRMQEAHSRPTAKDTPEHASA